MTLVNAGLPCPHSECASSDACSVYQNETPMWKCFSCGKSGPVTEAVEEFFADHVGTNALKVKRVPLGLLEGGKFVDLTNKDHPWGFRGISARVCEKYQVSVITKDGGPAILFPAYNTTGELVAQKLRSSAYPRGLWFKENEDSLNPPTFFGQHLFPGPSPKNKMLTITFGELDALAVTEMCGDWPVVSVPNGDQSALKTFKAQYKWLEQWETIRLIPDNDESCRAVLPALCQQLPRKIEIVTLTKHKDPCDYLKFSEQQAFRDCYWAARKHTPDKILSLASVMEDHLFASPPEPIALYPYDSMNEMLGGIYGGDIVVIKAPPGSGKTTFTTTLVKHVKDNTKLKIGLIYLEETKQDLSFRFATLELEKNLQRKEVRAEVTKDELLSVIKKYQDDDRIVLVDHGDTCSTDFLEKKVKELVLSCDVELIAFDHISMAVADDSNSDERIALDKALYMLRSLVNGGITETHPDGSTTTFHPALILVTHVNDRGQTRGSRAALQVGNVMISLERDPLHADPLQRNILSVVVEKNRRLGETGVAAVLFYNKMTGCFEDRTEMMLNPQEGEQQDDNT